MQEWQQRVVDEKAELDARLERLRAFLDTPAYRCLDPWTRDLMWQQQALMTALSRVLGRRIAIFTTPVVVKARPVKEK